MTTNPSSKLAIILRRVAQFISLPLAIFAIIFAVVMGAGDYGDGIEGFLKNLPNTLPWLLILIPVLIAQKRGFIGGLLLFILGSALVYYFNFRGSNFWLFTFFLTSLFPLSGLLYLSSWYISNKKIETNF